MASRSDEWVTRPIFVSSTFTDMQAERDYLRDFVFPAVEEDLRTVRCHPEFIDLRWGVDTYSLVDPELKEIQVLKVVLNEIKRSRPFLIVILGDRYGWVPPHRRLESAALEQGLDFPLEGKSITALEIEYGALHRSLGESHAFFYFRELDYSGIPGELRASYSDEFRSGPEARMAQEHLRALKGRIRKHVPESRIRTFQPVWDKAGRRLSGFESWGEQVQKDITEIVLRELRPSSLMSGPGAEWWQEEENRISGFVENKMRAMIKRDLIDDLVPFATSPSNASSPWAIVVTGSPGSGKSCLWAALHRQLRDRNCIVLANAAGISSKSGSISQMLARWIRILAAQDTDHAPRKLPDATSQLDMLEECFAQLLASVSENRRIVVLVDALDQFERTTTARLLSWIPRRWPSNARLVVTTLHGPESEALRRRYGVMIRKLEPLRRSEAEELLRVTAALYHKTLHEEVVQNILDKQGNDSAVASANPLWLSIAVEDLLLLDQDDFTGAQRFAGSPEEQLHQLLLERIRTMPPFLGDLYLDLLDRARKLGEKMLGPGGHEWVNATLDVLAASRYGLREHDIRHLVTPLTGIEWKPLVFAHLRRFLRAHLAEVGDNRLWNFAHRELREALTRSRLVDQRHRKDLHRRIGEYLMQLRANDSLREGETMHHLLEANALTLAREYYGLPDTMDSSRGRESLWLLEKYKGRELSHAALESASVSLADHQIRESERDQESSTDWLAYMFREAAADKREGYGLERLVYRLLNDVLRAIGDRARIGVQIRFLNTLRSLFQGIVPNVPEGVKPKAQAMERILGELHRRSGLRLHALLYFERALFIAEMNCRNLPGSATFLLMETLTSLGDLHLKDQPAEAIAFYERSNQLYETEADSESKRGGPRMVEMLNEFYILHGGVPDHLEEMARVFQLNFQARHMCRMGNACLLTHRLEDARGWFESAQVLSQKQSDQVRFNPEFAETLWLAGLGLAEVEWESGQQSKALVRYLTLAEVSTTLLRKSPGRILFLSYWARICLLISEGKYGSGEHCEGAYWLEEGTAALEEIRERLPDDVELVVDLLLLAERILASPSIPADGFPRDAKEKLKEIHRLTDVAREMVRTSAISNSEVASQLSQVRQIDLAQGLDAAAKRIEKALADTGIQNGIGPKNDLEIQAQRYFEQAHDPELSFGESKKLLRKSRDILRELKASAKNLDPVLERRLASLEMLFIGE